VRGPQRCRICASARLRTIPGASDHLTGERFDVVRCGDCGFGVTVPIPGDMERFYPSGYRRFGRLASLTLRALYRARTAGWASRLGTPGRVLELGAGTGWMLASLRERGWRATGTERSVASAHVARATAGAPVFVGELAALRQEPLFDLVIMFHVLEHLADPQAALAAAALRLRPGGTLVLGLPNGASWQAQLAGSRWLHLDVPRHLVHFSVESIRLALEEAGLRVVRVDFRSPEHDPLAWVQLALERLGSEQGLLLKLLAGLPRRSGRLAAAAALGLAALLAPFAMAISATSWIAGRGAVMEVWAIRDGD